MQNTLWVRVKILKNYIWNNIFEFIEILGTKEYAFIKNNSSYIEFISILRMCKRLFEKHRKYEIFATNMC